MDRQRIPPDLAAAADAPHGAPDRGCGQLAAPAQRSESAGAAGIGSGQTAAPPQQRDSASPPPADASRPLRLGDALTVARVLPVMRATTKKAALVELGALAAGSAGSAGLAAQIAHVLAERERLASTAIGAEVAIPHGKLDAVVGLTLALGRCSAGLDFESVDGKPTRLFFVLLAPENHTGVHLKALARISRLCKEPLFCSRLLAAADAREMVDVLRSEEEKFSNG